MSWEGGAGDTSPKWYRCGKVAETILNCADPGVRFQQPRNVQASRARSQLSAMMCLFNVLSDTAYPLDLDAKACAASWLLQGTEKEQLKIVGMVGMSPKLMHYFAKITYIAGRLYKVNRCARAF